MIPNKSDIMALTEDWLFSMITETQVRKSKFLLTGSLAELPMKYFLKNLSDIDIMIVPSDIVAVEEFDSKQRCEQLLIKSSETELGFVKLLSRDGRIYYSKMDLTYEDQGEPHGTVGQMGLLQIWTASII